MSDPIGDGIRERGLNLVFHGIQGDSGVIGQDQFGIRVHRLNQMD
ncbi:hypothetical protein [Xenorhabdus hominickii]|nr:hypothetical protein [Xenorhabdus hominickii]